MRYLIVITILLAISSVLYAAETSVGLNACVVLNDSGDETAESIVVMHFDLPGAVSGKEIIYVELSFSFSLQDQNDSALYEFMIFPATDQWSEETIDYEEAVDVANSMMSGSYTVRLTNQNEFHVDITNFVMEVVGEQRTNYGLIAITDLLGDDNLRLPANIGNSIRNSASVRIVYK
ncbi:MAG: DNRLRE domain-containing protein [Candidatus Zixiibacteriota bacterium]|nr:MAG: DNRLRE domain-containing protein [candidate division Zixibacteria bacterium]